MLSAVLLGIARATLVPGDLFRDHAVFQTTDDSGTAAKFVGTASPGASITLKTTPPLHGGKDTFTATTDKDGFWRFDVDSPADGPFTMQLTGDGGDLKISDTWFGDVYLCGGQSNMQFPMHLLEESPDKYPGDKYQNIRLFSVQNWGQSGPVKIRTKTDYAADRSEQVNLVGKGFAWNILSNETVVEFSAVCYLTARDVMLMQKQTSRAIGLVSSTVGGTPIEAWVPPGGLESCQYDEDLPNFVQGEDEVGDSWDYPSMLYNQMIAPLANSSYRGIMWYQGEANMDEGFALTMTGYECLFRNMISLWRSRIGQPNVPFVFMQLAACGKTVDFAERWASIREAQAKVDREVPFTGMGISFDHGASGIHTKWKIVPSHRLAYQLASLAFGNKTVPARPRVTGACAKVLGGRNDDKTLVTEVQVKIANWKNGFLNGTVDCHDCCNKTRDGLDGNAYQIGQITTANTNQLEGTYDATIELNDEGFLLRANTGNITSDKVYVWTARFLTGSYPQCGVYTGNGQPVEPFLDVQVSPTCDFEHAGKRVHKRRKKLRKIY